ncbi:hypothetical protein [Pseudarthrobacter sp. LT1]|uniref:hypothetical protein n=1 Tax=Pseudarthrobacter sp. LT1 TaxID=3111450 RepID=UPI002D77F16D|nr:hypothetical protein [Pseudarthrobacter sp. LT1]WRT15630.1 hypothetical protein VIK36_09205 [Pseudarthrobacter sp. LT1]
MRGLTGRRAQRGGSFNNCIIIFKQHSHPDSNPDAHTDTDAHACRLEVFIVVLGEFHFPDHDY